MPDIEQIDRDAASAAILQAAVEMENGDVNNDDWLAEAFARHRHSSTPQTEAARLEALEEAVARAICDSLEADNFDELSEGGIVRASYIQQAQAAIAAMSAHMLSDEAVERAQDAIWHEHEKMRGYDEIRLAIKAALQEVKP